MPGWSLWLVPPEDSRLYRSLHSLILTTIPAIYLDLTPPAPPFPPHVTLTADTIVAANTDPQAWLDSITLPGDAVDHLRVVIREVNVEDVFFRKLTLRCEKTAALSALAAACRAARRKGGGVEGGRGGANDGGTVAGAEEWVQKIYRPHCSLMYSDMPSASVSSRLETVYEAIATSKRQGVADKPTRGGAIWLVPTDRSIDEWKPVATRGLSDLEWTWET